MGSRTSGYWGEMFSYTICCLQLWPTADLQQGYKKRANVLLLLQNTLPATSPIWHGVSEAKGASFLFNNTAWVFLLQIFLLDMQTTHHCNMFRQGGPHLDDPLCKRPSSFLPSSEATVALLSWPPQTILPCCQEAVRSSQFSHPPSHPLQFSRNVGDCLKQQKGRREISCPYPGHWILWSKGSFMSTKLWITPEGAKDNCEHNSDLPGGQSGGSLASHQLHLVMEVGTKPSLPSFVPSTALLEH